MAFLIKVIAALAVAAPAFARPQTQSAPLQPPKPYLRPPAAAPGDISSYLPLIQKYVPGASLTLPAPTARPLPPLAQLPPRAGPPAQPFRERPAPTYDEPLSAPPKYEAPTQGNYHEVSVPSQELQVPTQTRWNPENDPIFYYQVKEDPIPTSLHPKKYDKNIHSAVKPFPKPYLAVYDSEKHRKLEKARQQLAKHENQKRVQAEKEKAKEEHVHPNSKNEPQAAESGFVAGYGDEPQLAGFTQGINEELKAALHGSDHHSPKERLDFQMHGHDGPDSYKWGFDHGEGHDRQFRFEERDRSGTIKGLYGYYDKHGKLQLVNYDADPHEGFHAEGNFGKF